jgi:hypothetical protein
VLQHAQTAATAHLRNAERLSIDQLAREFGAPERTLRAAVRTGRLLVTFTSRSAFGRSIRLASPRREPLFKASCGRITDALEVKAQLSRHFRLFLVTALHASSAGDVGCHSARRPQRG